MVSREVGFAVTEEYKSWINDVKMRIKQSQIKASVKINYELLDLYWELGRDIVSKQENAKWGDSFLNVMSKDLQKAFPGMSGFSTQNLRNVRFWYKFYNDNANCLQVVSGLEMVEKMVKSIPWGITRGLCISAKI